MASLTPRSVDRIIPLELMYNILTSLPAKTLLRFKCVCKDWYNLINDPVFIQLHLNNSLETDPYHHHHHRPFVFDSDESLYFGDDIDSPSQALVKFEHEHVGVIGSSNGLVCLDKGDKSEKSFIICNPSTRTFKLVPCPVDIIKCHWLLYGFGYDTQNHDYKVVLMKLQQPQETWVYSLKTDSWRLAPTQLQKKWLYKPKCESVFGHGMIHCILLGAADHRYEDDEQPQIARFNISCEKWEEDNDLGYPINYPTPHNVSSTFLDLDGHLCLSIITTHMVEIWIMKEYGIKESWTRLLRLPKSFKIRRPIAYSRTRPQVLWLSSKNERYDSIVCYDMQHKTREEFILNIKKNYSEVQVHLCAQSLVSIPGSYHMRGQTHKVDEEDTIVSSRGQTHQANEEDNTTNVPRKKEKKKGKLLYYYWSRTS